MAPDPSEKLLPGPSLPQIKIEKASISNSVGQSEDFASSPAGLQLLDFLFGTLVVAPLVVGVWRGCWGLMDLHAQFFPPAQSFVLGMVIHICFALIRSHLLARSTGARSGSHGSGARWGFERALSRLYTIVFALACILQWRGGWGLLDAAIEAVLGSYKSRRPTAVACAALGLVCGASALRATRNLLASPYFIVTDGKEPTYIFTTRFRKDKLDYARHRCAASAAQCARVSRVERSRGRSAPDDRRRRDSDALGFDADKDGAALARARERTRPPPAAMRGSTAGLADTLAGGSRVRAALLAAADALFASALIAPAVVTYWRSTWVLTDLYLLPSRPTWSAGASAALGGVAYLLMCVLQAPLSRRLRPERGPLAYYAGSRLYTALFGVACVNSWRGTWNLLNAAVGLGTRATLATTLAAALALAAMRGLRNVCSAPFAVAVDDPGDYFEVPTMFRTSGRDTALYVLDCVFSVGVVGSLVVFLWRGLWTLMDIFLYPGDPSTSNWASLVIGYVLVSVTFSLQAPARWACARLHGAPRLLLADLFHLLSFVATVNVWRGYWGLLEMYFLPDSPYLSNWICHTCSLTLLMLLNCSNSVLVRGVYIDAEEPAGECVVFPCHYLRLFFHRERTKKRHRRALLAAAAASARKSEDACVEPLAPLAPLASLSQEKV